MTTNPISLDPELDDLLATSTDPTPPLGLADRIVANAVKRPQESMHRRHVSRERVNEQMGHLQYGGQRRNIFTLAGVGAVAASLALIFFMRAPQQNAPSPAVAEHGAGSITRVQEQERAGAFIPSQSVSPVVSTRSNEVAGRTDENSDDAQSRGVDQDVAMAASDNDQTARATVNDMETPIDEPEYNGAFVSTEPVVGRENQTAMGPDTEVDSNDNDTTSSPIVGPPAPIGFGFNGTQSDVPPPRQPDSNPRSTRTPNQSPNRRR